MESSTWEGLLLLAAQAAPGEAAQDPTAGSVLSGDLQTGTDAAQFLLQQGAEPFQAETFCLKFPAGKLCGQGKPGNARKILRSGAGPEFLSAAQDHGGGDQGLPDNQAPHSPGTAQLVGR